MVSIVASGNGSRRGKQPPQKSFSNVFPPIMYSTILVHRFEGIFRIIYTFLRRVAFLKVFTYRLPVPIYSQSPHWICVHTLTLPYSCTCSITIMYNVRVQHCCLVYESTTGHGYGMCLLRARCRDSCINKHSSLSRASVILYACSTVYVQRCQHSLMETC